jgi:hypothetical protein
VQVFQALAARVLDPADGRWAFQSNRWTLQVHDHCSHWWSTISSSLLCSWRLSPAKRFIACLPFLFAQINIFFADYLFAIPMLTAFIPKWWIWGYWISPLMYGYNALAVNEFYSPRWMNKFVLVCSLHHCFFTA